MDGLEIRQSDKYGRCVFATKSFGVGSVLLSEKPFWLINESPGVYLQMQRLVSSVKPQQANLLVNYLVILQSFAGASKEVQQRILGDEFFCPDDALSGLVEDKEALDRTLEFAKKVPGGHLWSNDQLKRVLGVHQINMHSLGGNAALFEFGSRLTHSCDPNTSYFSDKGRGHHRVVKPIRAGDMVTTSYIEGLEYFSTRTRRKILQTTKCFQCQCSRCAIDKDVTGPLPCPICCKDLFNANGCLPIAVALGRKPISYMYWNPPTSLWECEHCFATHAKFPEAMDEPFEMLEMATWKSVRQYDVYDAVSNLSRLNSEYDKIDNLWTICKLRFGHRHWTGICLSMKLIQYNAAYAAFGPLPKEKTDGIVVNTVDVIEWFKHHGFDLQRYLAPTMLNAAEVLFRTRNHPAVMRYILDEVFSKDQPDENFDGDGGRLILEACRKTAASMPAADYAKISRLLAEQLRENPEIEVATKGVGSCASCGKPATVLHPLLRCGKCQSVAYCNRECQKQHWNVHRNICKNVK